eukprot:scaffold278223_cov24-Tisochrysis_lutea.AAC.1
MLWTVKLEQNRAIVGGVSTQASGLIHTFLLFWLSPAETGSNGTPGANKYECILDRGACVASISHPPQGLQAESLILFSVFPAARERGCTQ